MTELRKLLAEATPGPWTARGNNIQTDTKILGAMLGLPDDAALIVYLRNHVEDIAALIEAAAEAMEKRHDFGGADHDRYEWADCPRPICVENRTALAPFGDEK